MAVQLADAQAVETAIAALQVKLASHLQMLSEQAEMARQAVRANAPVSPATMTSYEARRAAVAAMQTDAAALLVLAHVVTLAV